MYRSGCQEEYGRVMGLVFDVVDCGAVDAGVVDAGEHQHLLVGFVAHHAGLLRLVLLRHRFKLNYYWGGCLLKIEANATSNMLRH